MCDNLSFSAYINNPFNKSRKALTETVGTNFYQNNSIIDYYRAFGINITYKFGKLNEEIKSTRRKINNNDLAN
ncbi:hypothetical protein ACM39_08940 [Chryseobacterium sp. FH2]|nr:hypothetical protein ACM39_08940 [Chryseobacterium sp. FH2]